MQMDSDFCEDAMTRLLCAIFASSAELLGQIVLNRPVCNQVLTAGVCAGADCPAIARNWGDMSALTTRYKISSESTFLQ